MPSIYTATTVSPSNGATIANPGTIQGQSFARKRNAMSDGITSKELESAVFEVAVESLLDLWQTRYGDEWVDIEALEDESFYALVYKRLKALGRVETHYLTDRARFVCRKPT
jgi:hypothetical protein